MRDNIFTADPEGFREQNAGRPAAHLIREAVQNVLDEAATKLDVTIEFTSAAVTGPGPTGVYFEIVDDVPGGIRDERLIWTIWLSDKTDSPQKRGRMGRGLKELISVSDEMLIVTEAVPAILFERKRGKWERTRPRKHRTEAGTRVEGFTRLWKKRDVDAVVAYLTRIRPPVGLDFAVNGGAVLRRQAIETYTLKLPTLVFELQEDGSRVGREPRRECQVELVSQVLGEPVGPEGRRAMESWVYEMGIPIERIDFPLSIDVGQRVPLKEKRDTLTEPYRRELFAKLLDLRVAAGLVQPSEMKDNSVMVASQAPEHLSVATKVAIAEAWTGGRPYATTPHMVSQATGQHISVVPLRSLPESVRVIAREVGTDVKQVIEEREMAACSIIDPNSFTNEQVRFVNVWSWIARGIRRGCTIHLSKGKPSAIASFNSDMRLLTVYVDRIGERVINEPLSAGALSTLIHELAHWQSQEDEHGMGFHADSEDVGGLVAAFLLNHASEALENAGAQ